MTKQQGGSHTPGVVGRDLAWGRNAVAFIRDRGLETEFNDWCGGWPCPVELVAPELLEALTLFRSFGCPVCNGDCGSANPPVQSCPMQLAQAALAKARPEPSQPPYDGDAG